MNTHTLKRSAIVSPIGCVCQVDTHRGMNNWVKLPNAHNSRQFCDYKNAIFRFNRRDYHVTSLSQRSARRFRNDRTGQTPVRLPDATFFDFHSSICRLAITWQLRSIFDYLPSTRWRAARWRSPKWRPPRLHRSRLSKNYLLSCSGNVRGIIGNGMCNINMGMLSSPDGVFTAMSVRRTHRHRLRRLLMRWLLVRRLRNAWSNYSASRRYQSTKGGFGELKNPRLRRSRLRLPAAALIFVLDTSRSPEICESNRD